MLTDPAGCLGPGQRLGALQLGAPAPAAAVGLMGAARPSPGSARARARACLAFRTARWPAKLPGLGHGHGHGHAPAHRQAPDVMRSCSMALQLLSTALGSYLGGGVVAVVQSASTRAGAPWLPKDLNEGRLNKLLIFFLELGRECALAARLGALPKRPPAPLNSPPHHPACPLPPRTPCPLQATSTTSSTSRHC
jgi:hypothetical protein